MVFVFTAAIALSAFLLFLVQPMAAKRILPALGGNPSVWNTCMLFYQCTLLLGYGYTHFLSKKVAWRPQLRVHLALLALPLLFLPLAIHAQTPPDTSHPIGWLLTTLLISVGLPFFAVSTTGPLLQRWFSRSGHPNAGNPYFLYAASNLGSMLALLAYPFLIEPWFTLNTQAWIWSIGYVLFLILAARCAWLGNRFEAATLSTIEANAPAAASISWKRRLRWIVLAWIPSSLMLGVNLHLTMDLAPVPLLWVIPLAIYLLSFILVFSNKQRPSRATIARVMPYLLVLFIFFSQTNVVRSYGLTCALDFLILFMCCMVCHGELAHDKPEPEHLTEFYLCLSVGGALGGIFNTLIAPLIFNSILEYPLAVVAACALLPTRESLGIRPARVSDPSSRFWQRPLFRDFAIVYVYLIVFLFMKFCSAEYDWSKVATVSICAGLPALLLLWLGRRPLRLALALLALQTISHYQPLPQGDVIFQSRNFFGVTRVRNLKEVRRLEHGTTFHGGQYLDRTRREEPLFYYHTGSPIASIMDLYAPYERPINAGLVGLGTGTLAAYGKPEQRFTFFELDPDNITLAARSGMFSYLWDAGLRGVKIDLVPGDGRLSIQRAPDHSFDLLVFDAFSSDAIPTHLLTREAFQLYASKLAPGGILAIHISNRWLRLDQVIGNTAGSAGFEVWWNKQSKFGPGLPPRNNSDWVVCAPNAEDLKLLTMNPVWERIPADPQGVVWTDDFSSLLSVLKP